MIKTFAVTLLCLAARMQVTPMIIWSQSFWRKKSTIYCCYIKKTVNALPSFHHIYWPWTTNRFELCGFFRGRNFLRYGTGCIQMQMWQNSNYNFCNYMILDFPLFWQEKYWEKDSPNIQFQLPEIKTYLGRFQSILKLTSGSVIFPIKIIRK